MIIRRSCFVFIVWHRCVSFFYNVVVVEAPSSVSAGQRPFGLFSPHFFQSQPTVLPRIHFAGSPMGGTLTLTERNSSKGEHTPHTAYDRFPIQNNTTELIPARSVSGDFSFISLRVRAHPSSCDQPGGLKHPAQAGHSKNGQLLRIV